MGATAGFAWALDNLLAPCGHPHKTPPSGGYPRSISKTAPTQGPLVCNLLLFQGSHHRILVVCPPLRLQGSYKIKYHANGPDADPIEIDFTPPWRRISMVSGLEDVLGIKLPENLESPEARKLLVGVGERVGGSVGLGGQVLWVGLPRKLENGKEHGAATTCPFPVAPGAP